MGKKSRIEATRLVKYSRTHEQAYGRNDLQPVAQALCPSIAEVARWLDGRFGNSRMTGSGSAVFAQVAGEEGGADGAVRFEGSLPAGWTGRMCRSLPRHPLRDGAD